MYGVPSDVDWSFLIGKELDQVCVGAEQVSLRLSGGVTLDLACDFHHKSARRTIPPSSELPHRAATLVSLLVARVITATSRNVQTLQLCFSNAETLQIYDANVARESFQIHAPGITIAV